MAAQNTLVSSTTRWNYDVFLSFRGEDTRRNFVIDLYNSLVQESIHTFMDHEELPRGEEISAELGKAIQQSRCSIVIFSKNFASSTWCLDELAKILDCKKAKGQLVLPVFYDIDPSNVRKQNGSVAEAFAEHEKYLGKEAERINRWRKALTEAGNLSGWGLCSAENGNKSMFIKKIVEEVFRRLKHKYLDIAAYPVGIDSQVKEVLSLLGIGSEDVRMIGICGMGGIGKTTIAKAIYNEVFHLFEGYCFLADVREVAQSFNGLVVLQKELLSKVLKRKFSEFGNAAEGINLIKKRLQGRRVFIVIDDVDQIIQLNKLARSCNWFGSGSRIIITTRDEHLLDEINVHQKYKVNELAADKSLELFSWHAFRRAYPREEYMALSHDIIRHNRLPLALEILGSYLFGRTLLEWENAIEKLQQIPLEQIQEKLKISFDSLDDKAKETFLDIACFFIGIEKEYAIKILDSRGFYPRIAISVLTSIFLLNVDIGNKLRMHDLVRDMGREIIRQESLKEPGRRSRLWFYEDVYNTLLQHKGTGKIEGMSLVLPELQGKQFNTKAFFKMDNLQLLQINDIHLQGSYNLLSKKLMWICWQHCPLTYLPRSFQLENLVALDMQYSSCKELWHGKKILAKLKILKLSHSHFLIKTPNLSGAPLLEKLFLEGCKSLGKIHHSIGLLNRLVHLNLEDCNNLRHLPNSICRLRLLEHLNLTGCTKLNRLPEDVGKIEGLKELLVDGTSIKRLPYSIGCLKNLISLSLQGCNKKRVTKSLSLFSSWMSPKHSNIMRFLPCSILGFWSITQLAIPKCNLSEGEIPTEIGNLSSLEILDLAENNFCTLPSSLSQLSRLFIVWLTDCRCLSSIPKLPPSLTYLNTSNCTSLEKLHLLNFRKSQVIFLDGWARVCEIQGPTSLNFAHPMGLLNCNDLATFFRDKFSQGQLPFRVANFLIVSDEPRQFYYGTRGQSICFNIPIDLNSKFQGFLFFRVSEVMDAPIAVISNRTNGVEDCLSWSYIGIQQNPPVHVWISQTTKDSLCLPFKDGETMEVSIHKNLENQRQWFGFHLQFESDFDK